MSGTHIHTLSYEDFERCFNGNVQTMEMFD